MAAPPPTLGRHPAHLRVHLRLILFLSFFFFPLPLLPCGLCALRPTSRVLLSVALHVSSSSSVSSSDESSSISVTLFLDSPPSDFYLDGYQILAYQVGQKEYKDRTIRMYVLGVLR